MVKKIITYLIVGLYALMLTSCGFQDWRTAPRHSAGLAPLPEKEPKAVVQVYAARAINWRGWFAVHTWVATKEANANHYTVYQVMGWQLRRTGYSVMIADDIPDRYWYGAKPYIIEELRGAEAAAAIPKIKAAAASYPYNDTYRVWPGPNSNTFVSHIIRNVPELGVELPPHAIGRDWLNGSALSARSETGTGYQVSLLGALGFTAGKAEGLEINILGLTFGVDVASPALKLPFIGRIGVTDKAVGRP
ncbi:MAG: DUF3750 domain-containing protein [Alphaproteobacteria bacterium]|nr:DUF3750 domain-containing protein [Alphaproteobacteria bacterium]